MNARLAVLLPGVARGLAAARVRGCRVLAVLLLWGLAAVWVGPARSDVAGTTLTDVQAELTDDGLYLSFAAEFALPGAVEDALFRGLALHFVAQADLARDRWYWTRQRVAQASRSWRLAYQPLTRRYRVTFDGSLGQTYDSLPEALAAIQRTVRWRIAEPSDLREDAGHRVMLTFRLDTAQLPRPFQIGITGNSDWNLGAEAHVDLEVKP